MDRIELEKLIYEIARAWGLCDRDIDFKYELYEEFDEISILVKIFVPDKEGFAWIDFWGDVSKHVLKVFDIMIFVEHKRESEGE